MMRSSVATMTPPRSRCLVTVQTYAERERFLQRRQQLEQQHAAQVSAGLALSAARERGLRVERNRQDAQEAEREVTRLVRRNGPRHPPPPLPTGTPNPEAGSDQTDRDASAHTSVMVEQQQPTSTSTTVPAPCPAPTTVNVAPTADATSTATTTTTTTSSVSVTMSNKVVAKPPLPAGALASASPSSAVSASNGVGPYQQARLRPVQRQPNNRTPSPAPYCPTPDYDSDSSGSTLHSLHTTSTAWTAAKGSKVTASASASSKGGKGVPCGGVPEVEMQSLDSMELLEPRPREPRPPQTYFQQQNGKTASPRPSVCVTIREYGGPSCRQPSKLTFLNNPPASSHSSQDPGLVGLQSELASTLSRSNLRCKTEAAAGPPNDTHMKEAEEAPKTFEEVSCGNVTVTSVNGTTSTSPFMPKGSMPNGILKKSPINHLATNGLPIGHGITPAILAGAGAALNRTKAGVSTKTISFGAKATIITEKQMSS